MIYLGKTLVDLNFKYGGDTASATDLLAGKLAHVNGTQIIGTIPTKGSSDVTIIANNITIPLGYYSQTITRIVEAGSATTPATTITLTPNISINSSGLITATVSGTQNITPNIEAGYISSGTAGTVTVSGTGTSQLTVRTSANMSVSGATITAPAGYYPSDASKSVSITTHSNPTVTINTATGLVTAQHTQSAGYITTSGTTSATLQLTSLAATTYTPTVSDQTISANKYLTGIQTIKGDSNLIAANIKKDVSIFGVTGTLSGGGFTVSEGTVISD